MYSIFHSIITSTQGTTFNKPLFALYNLGASYYRLLRWFIVYIRDSTTFDTLFRSSTPQERISVLAVLQEVQDMLTRHGIIDLKDPELLQDNVQEISFDFCDLQKVENVLNTCQSMSDDTTLITEDSMRSDDELSLPSELDEFVALLETCTDEDYKI